MKRKQIEVKVFGIRYQFEERNGVVEVPLRDGKCGSWVPEGQESCFSMICDYGLRERYAIPEGTQRIVAVFCADPLPDSHRFELHDGEYLCVGEARHSYGTYNLLRGVLNHFGGTAYVRIEL